MKFLRFEKDGVQKSGVLEGEIIHEISGDFYGNYEITQKSYKLREIKLLMPCVPSKVVAVGLNYIDHIKEMGHDMPKTPVLFVKLPHTYVGPEDSIIIPAGSERVDYEAELAVVIKKTCRKVRPEDANEYIFGATCLNDVTERNMQKIDGQWTRGKNLETFCPIGPYIVDGLDYNNLDIKLYLNGQLKQESNTSNLLWNVQELVSYISYVMPLNPGDVVTTGTTFGVGPMKDSDIVEVVIEGIGTLRNSVKNEK